MPFALFLFLQFIFCENEGEQADENSDLTFNIYDLAVNWDLLITHSTGEFSDKETQFQFSPTIKTFIMKSNGSVKIETTASRYISKLYHANISNNKIEFFDSNLDKLADIHVTRQNDTFAYLKGNSSHFNIFGFVSPLERSMMSIVSTNSDEVYLFRGKPPHVITPSELIQRILPSVAILFFMGFGRVYRVRFWKQYNQMNTRTLQNKINQASKEQKK